MDHTLCLYVEEGESRDKGVNSSENVVAVAVSDAVPSEVVGAWVRSAYDGIIERDLSAGGTENWNSITKQYKIKRQLLGARKQKIRELALDSDGIFLDLVFKLSGDVVALGHKVLLLCNEQFLQCDFGSNVSDKTSEISLSDIDFDTFRQIKAFFYCCDLDLTPQNVFDVLKAALKYHISGLANICEYYVIDHFGDLDCFSALSIARKVKSNMLNDYIMWHMKVQFDNIKDRKEFSELEDETYRTLVKDQWPGEKYHAAVAEWEKSINTAKDEKCVIQ